MIGIYKITNRINGKAYIGQSVHIERRFAEHRGSNVNSYIHNAIKKYGEENFTFEVIEQCKPEALNEREKYWILYFNTIKPNGYNLSVGGDFVQTKNASIPINEIIYDLQNTKLSLQDISKKYCINVSTVSRLNLGQTHYQEWLNYPIRKKKMEKPPFQKKIYPTCEICGIRIQSSSKRCKTCEGLRRRVPLDEMPISREELKTLIRTTPFTTIGKKFGVSDNAIRKWCDKYNLPRKASEIKKLSEQDWRNI